MNKIAMSPQSTRALAASLVFLALLVAAAFAYRDYRYQRAAALSLQLRLADTVRPAPADIVDCATVAPPASLVILALGQSSAGNHGQAQPTATARRIAMLTGQGCLWATDPLPGATGRGGSTWLHLPAAMAAWTDMPPLLLSVLAVESTSIADWTQPNSPLRARLLQHLGRMAELGHPPALVLWDQGAGDAMRHTPPASYRAGLLALAELVRSGAPSARILLAPTTVCRSGAALELHAVVNRLVAADPRFGPGPLLDKLLPASERYDGCHFSTAGLRHAADAWAKAVQVELSARR